MYKKIILSIFIIFIIDIARYFIYPDISELADTNPKTTAFIDDRIEKGAKIDQRWIPISQMSPNIIKAVLIGEDDKFYHHEGFDFENLERALNESLSGNIVGGSTITQQTAKNLYLSPSKNPIRKIKEAIITYRLENNLTKRRILEIYLNIAEWGDGIFGIEAASKHYYKKSAKHLTPYEASRLVAVLPNPIKYNPLSNQSYVKNRGKIIYKILLKRGAKIPHYNEIITPQQPKSHNKEINTTTLFEQVDTTEDIQTKEITPSPDKTILQ